MKKRHGLTLLELVIVLGVTALLLMSLSAAYRLTVDYTVQSPQRLADFQQKAATERLLHQILSQPYLSQDEDDRLTYFVASSSSGSGVSTDTLAFTSASYAPDGGFLRERDTDFQTLHETFGPQGGLTEIALSTVPTGSQAEGQGIFLRIQRPADGDYTQGGTESLLVPDARDLTFEFWDGGTWVTVWDTFANQRRLPAAIRLTYIDGLTDRTVVKVVRLVNSDINSSEPLTIQGGA